VHNSSCAKSRLVILRNACSFIRFSDFRSCVQFPASSFPSASQGKGPNVTTHEHHRPHLWHVVGAPSQGRSTRCGRGTHHLKCWCVSASARWAVLPARSRAKKRLLPFAFERRKAKAPSVFFFFKPTTPAAWKPLRCDAELRALWCSAALVLTQAPQNSFLI
jgi:hypothetical protein